MGAEPRSARGKRRRRALLEAAVEVAAERGIAGTTHREVARRAGVPLATTSYYFASIDELVEEALRTFVAERVAEMEALAERMSGQGISPDEAATLFAELLIGAPRKPAIAQLDAYVEAARRPALREPVRRAIRAFERLAETALRLLGARRPREAARAFVSLSDGFALHQLARGRDKHHVEEVRDAALSLFLAYAMDDDERAAWDRRLRVRSPGGTKPDAA